MLPKELSCFLHITLTAKHDKLARSTCNPIGFSPNSSVLMELDLRKEARLRPSSKSAAAQPTSSEEMFD